MALELGELSDEVGQSRGRDVLGEEFGFGPVVPHAEPAAADAALDHDESVEPALGMEKLPLVGVGDGGADGGAGVGHVGEDLGLADVGLLAGVKMPLTLPVTSTWLIWFSVQMILPASGRQCAASGSWPARRRRWFR